MPDDDLKPTTVTFSCTADQKEALTAAAQQYGWTVSAYLVRALGLAPWPDGVPPPTWPPIQTA